jgi:alkylated DNA repair dioxygenase AlkB
MPSLIGRSEVMTESNILPYDGEAILIDDHGAEFDWPAITRTLIETIPWQVETARIFGREMPIPRMTAWFGDGAYSCSGVLHLPAPFLASIERLRKRAEALSGASFNAALANLYRSGRDSAGWHSDNAGRAWEPPNHSKPVTRGRTPVSIPT